MLGVGGGKRWGKVIGKGYVMGNIWANMENIEYVCWPKQAQKVHGHWLQKQQNNKNTCPLGAFASSFAALLDGEVTKDMMSWDPKSALKLVNSRGPCADCAARLTVQEVAEGR